MQGKANVPAIRFAGFTDAWEQRKLGEVVQITMGQSPDGTTYSDTPSDYILVQGNADLRDGWVVPRVWTTQITKKADAGDLIMSVRAPAGAMGKTAYNAVIGRGVAAIKGNEFVFQLLVKMDFDGYWKMLSAGSTFESLNSDSIVNAEILLPSLAEQERIGAYLKNLDHLITLHQRKYSRLCNIKKSMLEKMFPKEGASVPEIRFAGFTDAWEQRKLIELYEVNNERNIESIPASKTLSVATMTFNKSGNGADDSSIPKYKVLRVGDVAFEGHTSKEFRYGRFVLNNNETGIMSPRFTALRPIVEQDYNFWEYYIHSEAVMRSILVNATKAGTMMNELVPDDLFSQYIFVPEIDEQRKIGALLKKLDHLITLHQRELERLQNIKKACLEKMFV